MSEKRSYKKADVNEVEQSRCKRCGSTERSKYENTRRQHLGTTCVDANGNEFNVMIWRRTRCLNPECGQYRDDIFRELQQDEPTRAKRKSKRKSRPKLAKPEPKKTEQQPSKQPSKLPSDRGPEIVGDSF